MAVVVWFCAGAAKSSAPQFCDSMAVISKEKPVSSSTPSVVVGDNERSPDFGSTWLTPPRTIQSVRSHEASAETTGASSAAANKTAADTAGRKFDMEKPQQR